MKILRLLPLIALLALSLLLIAGPGTRLELWDFRFGFSLIRWAVYLGLGSGALALIALLVKRARKGQLAALAMALVVGLGTAALPLSLVQKVRSLPYIHDISTDLVDPPAFVAVAPLRADAPNPIEYAGEEVAAQQREAYPQIQPLRIDVYPSLVFDHALDTARAMGWEIVASEPEEGRIEATDTTFWFGFKDDVVIRIRPDGTGSVVDVRSKSRVGLSDVGANAARIQRYLDALSERMQ